MSEEQTPRRMSDKEFIEGLRGPDGAIAPFTTKCDVIGCNRTATRVIMRSVEAMGRMTLRLPGPSFCDHHDESNTVAIVGGRYMEIPEHPNS